MKNNKFLLLFCAISGIGIWSCTKGLNTHSSQKKIEAKSSKILTINKLQFKDLNRNGALDRYEDWRLSPDERSEDLVTKLSLEQKAGLMLISTTLLENDAGRGPSEKPITSGFNEVDAVNEVNFFTRKPLDAPMMSSAGTTKDVNEFYKRHFILRANTSVDTLAKWANRLQELCEKGEFGIPATIASNPRNHITTDASVGLSMGKTAFTAFPGELGLAAMRDFDLVREFANISRQEWRAVGINKGYMYMADLATEPRWQRIEGTFGEDAELAAKMMTEIVLGFQGEKLGAGSVALTTKHFPGGGSGEGGQDPHFDWGKREVYPGGMFNNNLIPFKAAIEAGTSSIMPYYSLPSGTEYEEVGFAYNKRILQEILRGQLGFKGIINSDTGPIEMMPWGVEKLTVIERYKKALEAGVNLFSGTADPSLLIESIKKYPELLPLVNVSVEKILIEKFQLGLFENPYVDESLAAQVIGNDNFKSKADEALRKSIVLLRNNNETLPLKARTKVYFETYMQNRGSSPSTVFSTENNIWDLDFVKTPEEADVVLLWLIPKGLSLFQSKGGPLHVDLSNNGIDIDYVKKISNKPTILAINYTNPWAINEVYNDENGHIKGVLATFGTTPEAILDIVSGQFNPSGKMPFSTPVTDEAAQNQKSDVPGYLEGNGYEFFKFNEGNSYRNTEKTLKTGYLQIDDYKRSFLYHKPANISSNPKLVFVLHGSNGNGYKAAQYAEYWFSKLADQRGDVIVVYPNGYKDHWNECRKEANFEANLLDIDDVSFFQKMIKYFEKEYHINPKEVFVAGHSNGGHMVYKLAKEKPELFKKYVVVGASLPADANNDCIASKIPVSIMVINGTGDPINPYEGGEVQVGGGAKRGAVVSTTETMNYWANLSGEEFSKASVYDFPDLDKNDGATATLYTLKSNNHDIRLIKVHNGGHILSVPTKAQFPAFLGKNIQDINMAELIMDYFLK